MKYIFPYHFLKNINFLNAITLMIKIDIKGDNHNNKFLELNGGLKSINSPYLSTKKIFICLQDYELIFFVYLTLQAMMD